MASFDYDIGIIGGGPAGLTIAAGCARSGAKTLLVEREPELGGDCLHYGSVPSKTLIHAARVYHLLGQTRSLGLPRMDLPPVEFNQVSRRIREVISRIQQHDSRERFCKLGAAVHTGSATFVDEHQITFEDGTRFSAEKWVVATGSSPAIPPVPGLGDVDVLTNRDIFSLDRLPASMIILGGGSIAVEMAQAFARLGTLVTIIQRSGQLLSREDPDMALIVHQRLEQEGVIVRTGLSIARVSAEGEMIRIKATDGQGKNLLFEAEKILVALGRTPNIKNLGLDQAGVDHTSRGIVVDQCLRTSQEHIYAAGDATGQFLFSHAAGYEGEIVVSNAVFNLSRTVDYTLMPWCTYTDPELAGIGYTEKQARYEDIEYNVITESFVHNDRSLTQNQETGLLKLILDHTEKPLGVQIVGPHAGELLNEWVALFTANMNLSTLAAAVHLYPTLSEINKQVAGSYLAPKSFPETTSKASTLSFPFKGRTGSLPDEGRGE